MNFKKGIALILIGLTLLITVVGVLAVWEIIDVDFGEIMRKSFISLIIIFISSALILFITTVLYKDKDS
jgi:putative effector of murein hydrolase LrgA (UPF0299 family)